MGLKDLKVESSNACFQIYMFMPIVVKVGEREGDPSTRRVPDKNIGFHRCKSDQRSDYAENFTFS